MAERSPNQIIPVEEQFRIMADTAPVMIWISGTDKLCYFFNQGWLSFTGRTLDEEMGNGWLENVHPDDVERYLNTYHSSFETHHTFRMEYRLKRYDGQYRWLLNNGVPRYASDGSFAGYIGSCIDIHEMVEAESLKDEFINSASHELKTPVTTIKVYAQMLEDFFDKEGNEKPLKFLKKVNTQVVKLTKLINNLVDLTKIQGDVYEYQYSYFDFNKLIADEVRKSQYEAERQIIHLDGFAEGQVFGDKERIRQVISNILDNAIKFSPNADSIEVVVADSGQFVEVSVTDHGIGIDKNQKNKIFNRFYRVYNRTANTFPGLGLGLYIASQIIQQHGGEIGVDSDGKDTSFTFTIPYRKEQNS
ncbi:MAG TPA: PAS domain-containing sensor histidine kinase [Sphingobacteriaceae bacterium]